MAKTLLELMAEAVDLVPSKTIWTWHMDARVYRRLRRLAYRTPKQWRYLRRQWRQQRLIG